MKIIDKWNIFWVERKRKPFLGVHSWNKCVTIEINLNNEQEDVKFFIGKKNNRESTRYFPLKGSKIQYKPWMLTRSGYRVNKTR